MAEENRNIPEQEIQVNTTDAADAKASDAKGIKYVLVFMAVLLAFIGSVIALYGLSYVVMCGYTTGKVLHCAAVGDPDAPVVSCADFPITVTYEHDGEIKTVHDTLVCQFDGYVWESSDFLTHRKWSFHLESGKYITLFQGGEHYITVLDVDCSAAWMMGDEEEAPEEGGEPSWQIGISFGEREKFYPYDEDEIYRNIGIRVLSFEVAPPIENTFAPAE